MEEGIGAEVSQKIRSAIKAKFKEIGLHVDEELPDYVMVMVANHKSKEQMDDDLQLFLGKHTSLFTTWLHQVLQKLQEVTVAKLDVDNHASSLNPALNLERLIGFELYENRHKIGGIKRKSLDEPKKKKKSKQDSERKEIKKKIKEEPVDKDNSPEVKDGKRDSRDNQGLDNGKESQTHDANSNKKQKIVIEKSLNLTKDKVHKNKKQKEDLCDSSPDEQKRQLIAEQTKKSDRPNEARSKSHSTSSQAEDLDDEDCINIGTDRDLLETAEDVNFEDSSKTTEKENTNSKSETGKDVKQSKRLSPARNNWKSKFADNNPSNRISTRDRTLSPKKRSPTPPKTSPKTDEKVVDARELLNRKKAAKQSDSRARSRSRSREKDRSVSPVRKRREEERETRSYREDRGSRRLREEDRETSSRRHSREEERDRKGRDMVKRRDDWPRKLESDKIEQRNKERRRDPSIEPPPKRVMLDRTYRNKTDDWGTVRNSKTTDGHKVGAESPKRKDSEEGLRRSGLVSRVVTRPQEPEEDGEVPGGVPSVVKVTPRPRRPPSQQPSSSLIIRAISEANKSLANVTQRPDSTQRGRKEPVFSRPLRQLRRIPPEKIAVEIKNPLALQNVILAEPSKEEEEGSVSPIPKDKSGRNVSPPPDYKMELTPPQPEITTPDIVESKFNENKVGEEKIEELQVEVEDEIELEPSQEIETFDEPMDEAAEPQFVVTLNGYDPDGIFSQSELDEDDEEPLLTSTPEEVESPRPKREINSSPKVIMGPPAVNHNNLIEVEISRLKTERCKYWPACRLGDKCTYYHPSKPCKAFPNCKFGDGCIYIHPQCKFNALCTRKDCVFAHTSAHTPVQPTVVAPKAKALYAASAPPCKFFPNCTNIHCQFSHPPRACRFGLYCTKKDCSFDHGQVAPVDKLKWTRVPPS